MQLDESCELKTIVNLRRFFRAGAARSLLAAARAGEQQFSCRDRGFENPALGLGSLDMTSCSYFFAAVVAAAAVAGGLSESSFRRDAGACVTERYAQGISLVQNLPVLVLRGGEGKRRGRVEDEEMVFEDAATVHKSYGHAGENESVCMPENKLHEQILHPHAIQEKQKDEISI